MKSTLKKNAFVYVNASGRRVLTPLSWSIITIMLILALITAFGFRNANATRSMVEATPQLLVSATVTPTDLPKPTEAVTDANGCPTDSSQWNFVDVSADSNYKRIEPTCVYDGLARTVAWRVLWSVYGYDVADAGNLLGFGSYASEGVVAPYREFAKLVVRAFQGEQLAAIEPLYPPMKRHLRAWEVGPDKGILSGTYMLQGCYRTYDVVGNAKQYIWDTYKNTSYEAICQISFDSQPMGWFIADYGDGVVYSGPIGSGRALLYFGYYSPEGVWDFFGFIEGNVPGQTDKSQAAEYQLMQEWYGAPVWDHTWFQSYGIAAAPLPERWEERNTAADYQALIDKLEQSNQ